MSTFGTPDEGAEILGPLGLAVIPLAVFAGTALGMQAPLTIVAIALVGAVMTLRRPELAIVALVAMAIANLASVAAVHFGLPMLNEVLLPGLALVLLLRYRICGEAASALPVAALGVAVYIAALAATALYAPNPELAVEGAINVAKDAIVALLVLAFVIDFRRFAWAVGTIAVVAAFLGFLTILQYLTGSYGDAWGGLANASVQQIEGRFDSWRPSGPLDDANYYAQSLVLALPICFDRMLHGRRRHLRLAGLVGTILIAAAIVLTYSRGGLLAMVVVCGILLWQARSRPAVTVTTVLLVGIAVAILIPHEYLSRIEAATVGLFDRHGGRGYVSDVSVLGRLSEMAVAWQLFVDHFLIGVGYNQYEIRYQDTAMIHGLMARGADREAHSLYLELLAERGLAGVAFFAALVGSAFMCIRSAVRSMSLSGHTSEAHLAGAFGIGILGYLVAAVFLHDDYARGFWLALALAWSLPQAASLLAGRAGSASLPVSKGW